MDARPSLEREVIRRQRAEHLGLLVILCALAIAHAEQIAWGRFAFAFALIDLAGYLPGALAFRRAGGGSIPALYHHLYNLTHSLPAACAAVILWAHASGGMEWAMLAVPIHLCGDRGVFGNFAKPASQPFETPQDPRRKPA
jgi:hypothetical protein